MTVFLFFSLSLFLDDLDSLIANALTHPSSLGSGMVTLAFRPLHFYPLYLYIHPAFSQFYLDSSRFSERIQIVVALCLGSGEASDSLGPGRELV